MIQTWGDSYSGVGIKERFWLWLQWELESESFFVNVNGGISESYLIGIVMSGILNRDSVWFRFHTFM